jgi:hypothetical protein
MLKKLLFITAICFALNACYDKYKQELVVVNKIPRGAYANEEMPEVLHGVGWYDIGLSRNGEEPVEYYLRISGSGHFGYYMSRLEVGDRGIIYLDDYWIKDGMKLPPPNAKDPPIIGFLEEVSWKRITIPNTPTTIGDMAFYGKKLKRINIPGNTTAIGDKAFQGCRLTSITIPNGVTFIGKSAFWCNKLTSVTIPDSVTFIGDLAFYGNQLTSVIIGNGVVSIGDIAFDENRITDLTIGASVTSIGNCAFRGNQLTSITLPDSVTLIDYGAFAMNPLTSVTIGTNVVIKDSEEPYSSGLPHKFNEFYAANKRKAGTYVFMDGRWVFRN